MSITEKGCGGLFYPQKSNMMSDLSSLEIHCPSYNSVNSLEIKGRLLRIDTKKKLNLAWSRWFVVASDFEERLLSNVCDYKYTHIHAFAWHLYPSRIVVNIKNICYFSYCYVFILEWPLQQGSSKLLI